MPKEPTDHAGHANRANRADLTDHAERAPKVLLVEDDADLLKINSIHLSRQGYTVMTADTLKQAYEAVRQKSPHLIVLDVNMPDGSGMQFCREIRKTTTVPIIFLTCYDEYEDRVEGLMAGGDDYLTKPYSLAELSARIHALLRRSNLNTKNSAAESRLTFSPLTIDTIAQRVYVHGRDVLLSTKEYQVFLILARNVGITMDAAKLYEQAWGLPPAQGLKTVQVHISALRKKLKTDDNSEFRIQTIRNVGYRFEYEKSD